MSALYQRVGLTVGQPLPVYPEQRTSPDRNYGDAADNSQVRAEVMHHQMQRHPIADDTPPPVETACRDLLAAAPQ